MQNSTSVAPYMSSNLREYNRIYKKVNDIYTGRLPPDLGFLTAHLIFYIQSVKLAMGACSVMCAMLLLFPNRRYIHPSVN